MNPVPPSIPEHVATQLIVHADFVVRIYCRLLRDHDQRDIAQDALAALVERVHDGRPVEEPYAWLVKVVRNLHAARCRARRRDKTNCALLRPNQDDGTIGGPEPACRADPWAELEQLLDEVVPPYSEEEKDDLRALAAGRTRHQIARERGMKDRVVEARIKKNLESLEIFLGCGKSTGSET